MIHFLSRKKLNRIKEEALAKGFELGRAYQRSIGTGRGVILCGVNEKQAEQALDTKVKTEKSLEGWLITSRQN